MTPPPPPVSDEGEQKTETPIGPDRGTSLLNSLRQKSQEFLRGIIESDPVTAAKLAQIEAVQTALPEGAVHDTVGLWNAIQKNALLGEAMQNHTSRLTLKLLGPALKVLGLFPAAHVVTEVAEPATHALEFLREKADATKVGITNLTTQAATGVLSSEMGQNTIRSIDGLMNRVITGFKPIPRPV